MPRRTVLILLVLAVAALLAFWLWLAPDATSPVDSAPRATTMPAEPVTAPGLAGRPEDSSPPADKGLEKPATPWSLEGRVHGPQGRGVAGATVHVSVRRGGVVTDLASSVTDGKGSYRLDLSTLATWHALVLATSIVRVHATGEGYLVGSQEELFMTDHSVGKTIDLDLKLRQGCRVAGRVLDESGAPVLGVEVLFKPLTRDGAPPMLTWSLQTERTGEYDFVVTQRDFSRWKGFLIVATSPGGTAASEPLDLEWLSTVQVADLVLPVSTAFVEGIAVREDGTPAPGITIWRWTEEEFRIPSRRDIKVVSDAEGRFKMPMRDGGEHELSYDAVASSDHVTCRAGDRNVRIMIRECSLLVRVVTEDGTPLPGAELSFFAWNSKFHAELETLMSGSGTWEEMSEGPYDESVADARDASGAVRLLVERDSVWLFVATVPGGLPAEHLVPIDSGQWDAEVELVVRSKGPVGELALVVLAPDGSPVQEYAVEVRTLAGTMMTTPRVDSQGRMLQFPAGRVRLAVIPERGDTWPDERPHGQQYLLPMQRILDVPKGGKLPLRLQARQGGRFRLTLKSSSGNPPSLRWESVSVRSLDDLAAAPIHVGEWMKDSGNPRLTSPGSVRDETGVNAHLLKPGDYTLTFRQYASRTYNRQLRIRAGELTDVVIELER